MNRVKLNRYLLCLTTALAVSCAPGEAVTEYQGILSGYETLNGETSPTLALGGVGIRIARQEGVVTRVEFSSECVVRVTASGGAVAPEPGQTCVATVGHDESHNTPGVIRTSAARVECEPATLSITEHSATRVSVSMLCRQTWTYERRTSTRDVHVTFTPLGG